MDDRRPHATSLGIWQGRIVGLDEDLYGLDAVEVLDLDGATVTPGFIDAHCHTTWFGLGWRKWTFPAPAAWTSCMPCWRLTWLRQRGEAGQPDGSWPPASARPSTAASFRTSPSGSDHREPAAVYPPQLGSHGRGQHRRAAAGRCRSPSFPDPDGGVIVRDAAGLPTGLVQETAQQLIQQLILPYTWMASKPRWTGHPVLRLGRNHQLHRSRNRRRLDRPQPRGTGRLPARYGQRPAARTCTAHAGPGCPPPTGWAWRRFGRRRQCLDLGMYSGFGNEFLSLGPAKVFLDGSLLGETAAVSEAYCSHGHTDNSSNTGYFQADPESAAEPDRSRLRGGLVHRRPCHRRPGCGSGD